MRRLSLVGCVLLPFSYGCVCVCRDVGGEVCRSSWRREDGVSSPGAEVTANYEPQLKVVFSLHCGFRPTSAVSDDSPLPTLPTHVSKNKGKLSIVAKNKPQQLLENLDTTYSLLQPFLSMRKLRSTKLRGPKPGLIRLLLFTQATASA